MRLLYSIVAVSTLFYTLALSLDTWATAHEQYEDPSVAVDFEFGLRKVYLDYQFSNQPKTSRDVDYEEFCDNIGFITKGGDCDKLTEGASATFAFLLVSAISCGLAGMVTYTGTRLHFNYIYITVSLLLTTVIANTISIIVWCEVADDVIQKYFDREIESSLPLMIVPLPIVFIALIR
eukprot:TRINITY_DN4148_c0_g2_i2.p1 TRINITY_DN4148_c0_g2~~TRINITY_DN4148_c0_g2_i2.p1  ORF type:complete len:178 (-),score=29.51 TRINITY_DN4148_c0_g2_i2:540-1073(-)